MKVQMSCGCRVPLWRGILMALAIKYERMWWFDQLHGGVDSANARY